jgi:hypothetical protein
MTRQKRLLIKTLAKQMKTIKTTQTKTTKSATRSIATRRKTLKAEDDLTLKH